MPRASTSALFLAAKVVEVKMRAAVGSGLGKYA